MKIPNIPPKKLLVPFDFSAAARRAWGLGKELAAESGASIEAVFVYEAPLYAQPMMPMPTAPVLINPLTPELKRRLLDDMRRELGEGVQAAILQGFPRDGILAAARERSIDLIVMGTHGRTGVSRVLFGSVAESLSRHSPVPVVTVRDQWKPIRSILAPVNFMDYSLAGFWAAAQLAERLGARFDVLYVEGEPHSEALVESAFELALKDLPACFAGRPPRLLRGAPEPAERIITVGADYDLIAMVAHRRAMFHDLVLGTTAERVLRHSTTPVLAVPSGAPEAGRPARKKKKKEAAELKAG